MTIAKQTRVAICPDCEERIEFSQALPKVGLKLACPQCETYLEVVSLNPLRLSWDDGMYDEDWDSNDEDW
ncbi:MAG: lysine biosynthesis protein LysW [Anaerolineae bacterium]|nr:lysine biosynthesis protein LysW [Anaerolineae bacterium]